MLSKVSRNKKLSPSACVTNQSAETAVDTDAADAITDAIGFEIDWVKKEGDMLEDYV